MHALLDGRNTAAIFNAAAMAAGGGSGVAFLGPVAGGLGASAAAAAAAAAGAGGGGEGVDAGAVVVTNGNGVGAGAASLGPGLRALRIDTDVGVVGRGAEEGDSANSATSASASEIGSASASGVGEEREVWAGELSAVVGLQKRGLRGLMEGRRIREMGRSGGGGGVSGGAGDGERVGLGIA